MLIHTPTDINGINGLSCFKWIFLNLCFNVVVIGNLYENTPNWNKFINTLSVRFQCLWLLNTGTVFFRSFFSLSLEICDAHNAYSAIGHPNTQAIDWLTNKNNEFLWLRAQRGQLLFVFFFFARNSNDDFYSANGIIFWIIVEMKIFFNSNVIHNDWFVFGRINTRILATIFFCWTLALCLFSSLSGSITNKIWWIQSTKYNKC